MTGTFFKIIIKKYFIIILYRSNSQDTWQQIAHYVIFKMFYTLCIIFYLYNINSFNISIKHTQYVIRDTYNL